MSRETSTFYVTIAQKPRGSDRYLYRDALVKVIGSKRFYPLKALSKIIDLVEGGGAGYIVHVSLVPEKDLGLKPDVHVSIEVYEGD